MNTKAYLAYMNVDKFIHIVKRQSFDGSLMLSAYIKPPNSYDLTNIMLNNEDYASNEEHCALLI